MYLPTLSEEGYVNNDSRIADYIFAHAFASDYSQSIVFRSNVTSVGNILYETNGDVSAAVGMLSTKLTKYYESYFDNVNVEVADISNPNQDYAILSIYITCVGKESRREVNLGRTVEFAGSIVSRIAKIYEGATL